MSKGIVVVGGAEEEHYNLLGEDRLRPIINVRPEGNDIYNKLESLLANTNKITSNNFQTPFLIISPFPS